MEGRSPEGLRKVLLSAAGPEAAGDLARIVGPDPGGDAMALLRQALALAPVGDLSALARHCLARPALRRDPHLLSICARRGDHKVRLALRKTAFAALLGTDPAVDAVYAGLTMADDERRVAHLEEVEIALQAGDEDRLRELAAVLPVRDPPPGHVLVLANLGAGKTSRVALVRREADGALFAWKIPVDDGGETRLALDLQVRRSAEWTALGLSESPAAWAPDGATLLQAYVEGTTLREMLKGGSFPTGTERDALAALFTGLVERKGYVSGLNADNLIFDRRRWQVVDSGTVRAARSVRVAWRWQRKDLLRKWTRDRDVDRTAVLSFLDDMEARLPDRARPHSLERVLRRLRGLG